LGTVFIFEGWNFIRSETNKSFDEKLNIGGIAMFNRNSVKLLLVGSVSFAVLGSAPGAFAADAADVSAKNSTATIEELVVTAERREESLQLVPIAVSAFSQATLDAKQIAGVRDLQTGVPNVTFSKGSRGDSFQIRGIGSNGLTVAGDEGTGIHLDGLPTIDKRIFEMDFLDEARVYAEIHLPERSGYTWTKSMASVDLVFLTLEACVPGSIRGARSEFAE
jgi:hypothetical protein